jgi:flagellar hook assembly protein FlgD
MDTTYRIQSILPQPPAALADNANTQTNPETDFLKLMVAQLQNQDPDKPMDGTAMITQMTQMDAAIAMQRMGYLNKADNAVSTAASLLGRQVTLKDPHSGKSITGKVSTVDYSGNLPAVMVNGQPYPLDAVSRVDL